ncbi:diguanylate cyclase domain-containing protein [Methylobacterium sp. NEAU K]|uniref:diguanylate cyclase domain-containing protein n=1 Tax=Methylobacterium sp. NEAU K TaxID=3064946 RepID=UPI00273541FE|nr:diguanylate cyclase [Methylobacterium sp. NEAU K]MDP4002470.1 diguanylate cyclase [Methylobacterium sp. NEAU K]
MILRSTDAAIRALLADRASRLITAGGASLLVCLILLGTYLCIDLRDIAWHNAQRNTENLLSVIEEGVGNSIRSYHESLRGAARLAARSDIPALDADLRRLALFDSSAKASGLGPLEITDAAGHVQITNDPNQTVAPDLSDLPEFQALRSDPSAGLILTGPSRSRVTGREIIRLSRRIETPDGSFVGIVTGVIFLDHFQTLFRRLSFDDGLTFSLFHRDGTLMVRAPTGSAFPGRSIATSPGYRVYAEHQRGEFLGRPFLDGQERLYAFANLDELPLVVMVAMSAESIRAAWICKATIIAVLFVCLNVLTFGLTILLQREVGRHAAAEASSREANAALVLLARTDGLTGMPNRRSYDEVFSAEWSRAAQRGAPLALMIVDADHFKQFNDRFGHHCGDAVLRSVADCLRQALDGGGIGFRIGGEEFAAILPGLDAAAASSVAERVRRAVVNLRIAHAPEVGGVATVSVGVASAEPCSGAAPDALFVAADAALYAAKKAGRNRVRAASSDAPVPYARRA